MSIGAAITIFTGVRSGAQENDNWCSGSPSAGIIFSIYWRQLTPAAAQAPITTAYAPSATPAMLHT